MSSNILFIELKNILLRDIFDIKAD